MSKQADSILVKITLCVYVRRHVSYVRDWLGTIPALGAAQLRPVWSDAQQSIYLYFDLAETAAIGEEDLRMLEDVCRLSFPQAGEIVASRLLRVFDVPGASSGEQPAFHYVVETDAEPGWMDEIANWYDTEHMPGLAGVPGCIRASHLLNQDHSPLSYACFDLVSESTLGSPPWLTARGSDWSSRVRPHFTNTLRTMFAVADHANFDLL